MLASGAYLLAAVALIYCTLLRHRVERLERQMVEAANIGATTSRQLGEVIDIVTGKGATGG